MPQHLDLDDTEADALAILLTHAIGGDRYPPSSRSWELKYVVTRNIPAHITRTSI